MLPKNQIVSHFVSISPKSYSYLILLNLVLRPYSIGEFTLKIQNRIKVGFLFWQKRT